MKALIKKNSGYDNMELLDIAIPQIQDSYVRVKVAYSGICGTDIHTFKGEYGSTYPVVLGHEFSGIVSEIGSNVKNIKVGDKITSETTFSICGTCPYCLTQDYNLCASRKGIGTAVNGSMAEEVLLRADSVHVLNNDLSLESIALTEPLACCVHATLEKTVVTKHDTVLIFGPGPIGNMVAQIAKSQGATVILAGITSDVKRLELAKSFGIDKTVDVLSEDLKKIVLEMTNGEGANKTFDCSGSIIAVNQGLALTKKLGDFVQVGLFATPLVELNTEMIIQKELHYIGCRSQKPSSWKKAIELMSNKQINTEELITKIVSLDSWREGFDAVIKGTEMKVLIKS